MRIIILLCHYYSCSVFVCVSFSILITSSCKVRAEKRNLSWPFGAVTKKKQSLCKPISAPLNLTQQIHFRFTASSSSLLLTVFLSVCRTVCTFSVISLHPLIRLILFVLLFHILVLFAQYLLSSPLQNRFISCDSDYWFLC